MSTPEPPLPTWRNEKYTFMTLRAVPSFTVKSSTNQQPRALHRAGKYQIELVNKTHKNAGKIYVAVAIFTMAGVRAW